MARRVKKDDNQVLYIADIGQLLPLDAERKGFGRIAPLRGWLVNHRLRAATTAQIGQVIGCIDLRLLARPRRCQSN